MQLDPNRELIRMFVERILDEIFPDETGAARLQQVGLFTLIYMLQGDEKPVTAARISEMTGQSESQIHHQLQKLMKLKLVERTKIPNKQGRGSAFQLSIKHNAKTKRLAAAIAKGGAGKR